MDHTLVGEIVLLSTALSAVALSIYVRTLCPSVPGGDSGEMVQVAIELGVAHPPGYPTWTLIANAFSRLPWGEPAWRINLSSAVADAAASGLLSGAVGLWAGCAWTGHWPGLKQCAQCLHGRDSTGQSQATRSWRGASSAAQPGTRPRSPSELCALAVA